jgi:hypothetical protein
MKQGNIWKIKVGILVKTQGRYIYTKIATAVAVLARHSFNAFSRYTLKCVRKKPHGNKSASSGLWDLPSSSISNRASGKQVLGAQVPSLMGRALIPWEEAVGRSFPLSCRSTC